MLDKKGTGEFTKAEVRMLVTIRKQIAIRLQVNAIAASTPIMIDTNIQRMTVKYEI